MNWQDKLAEPPAGYRYGPSYRASWPSVIRGIIYILRGERRSLAHDALYAVADMPVPPMVRGEEHIPDGGPLVVAANHYERPGLWMAWPALFVSHLLQERTGRDVRWLAIQEWESFSLFGVAVPRDVIRAVFERAFGTYGIIAMPPMDAPMAARAASMRATAREVRAGAMVGLMPEATVGQTPELLEAREGVGTFLSLLTAGGARILPLGLYEEDDRLVAHFGEPLTLDVPRGLDREESDRWVRDRVMHAIRDLLPEVLWGAYR